MKAFLMYRDRDVDLQRELPPNAAELIQDLELNTLFNAMSLEDKFLFEASQRAVLSSLHDPEEIVYRQQVLRDCLKHPQIIREMYAVVVEALKTVRTMWRGSSPDSLLYGSTEALQLFVRTLKQLRRITDEHAGKFRSDGFTSFFATLAEELDDEYFQEIEDHLTRLQFEDGVLISAELGKGNKGTHYVLRRSPDTKQGWVKQGLVKQGWAKRISSRNRSTYSFQIDDRDEAGAAALRELRAKGISLVVNALSQSEDHILSFFRMLQAELAFYLGCINMYALLAEKREPICFPVPVAPGTSAFSARGLYDACLSLIQKGRVVGNDVSADNKSLVMITGANQGGKSTFLRSVGLAQLMMQCGMFVPAESFRANVCRGLFTHYRREEDSTMKSGKLDEELSRMSDIADMISSNCVVLFNESFAATNEREGSEIARQVIRALLEADVKVFFVTHLYELVDHLFAQKTDTALFLRAERQADGRRTFRLIKGEPLPTSYGVDLYRQIFEREPSTVRRTDPEVSGKTLRIRTPAHRAGRPPAR